MVHFAGQRVRYYGVHAILELVLQRIHDLDLLSRQEIKPSQDFIAPLMFQRGRDNNQDWPVFPVEIRNGYSLDCLAHAHLVAEEDAAEPV